MNSEPIRNKYVGHRYVPKIMGEWDKSNSYEGLSIVTYQGTSYTSKKFVPMGMDLLNEEYWAVTGNYNAQVDQYRQEVNQLKDEVDSKINVVVTETQQKIDMVKDEVETLTDRANSVSINVLFPPSPLQPAISDQNVDNSPAIQAMIEYLNSIGGGELFFPPGNYQINTPLQGHSNIIFRGVGEASTIKKNNGNYFIKVEGELEGEFFTSANKSTGDTVFSTTVNNGFQAGDLLLIKSQRNALTEDGGDQWQLGGATGATSSAYYGEFLVVTKIIDGRTFEVGSGLIYPDYRIDNSLETSPTARTRTTIQRVKAKKNVIIRDLTLEGDVSGGIRFHNCYNCHTENVTIKIAGEATAIYINESFYCTDSHSKTFYDPSFIPSDHYKRNAYKVVSSQSCGYVGSYCEFGTQPFDFTFNDGSIVTTFPYAERVETHFSTQNGFTSHGGTYGTRVIDSKFLNCIQYGISTRSRNTTIKGNIIQGSFSSQFSYAIALYEGHAVDCLVEGNQISGFNKGVTILDGATSEKFFKWIGAIITGNTFKNVNRCIIFERNENNDFQGSAGVNIINNNVANFIGQYSKFVLTNGVDGINIANNIVNDPYKVANAGIYIVNSDNIIATDNLFNGIFSHLWVEPVTDGRLLRIKYSSKYYYTASQLKIPEDGVSSAQYHLGNFMPRDDDTYTLGWSGGRWKTVFATNGVINTSDRDYKQDIHSIPDEWLDAWESVNYSVYKFKQAIEEKGDKARWHVGVIAQEINEAFQAKGLDATEIGLLCYDEWINEETGKLEKIWSVRPSECHFMESALLRRELERLKGDRHD